jgi:hypothetical protein
MTKPPFPWHKLPDVLPTSPNQTPRPPRPVCPPGTPGCINWLVAKASLDFNDSLGPPPSYNPPSGPGTSPPPSSQPPPSAVPPQPPGLSDPQPYDPPPRIKPTFPFSPFMPKPGNPGPPVPTLPGPRYLPPIHGRQVVIGPLPLDPTFGGDVDPDLKRHRSIDPSFGDVIV